MTDLYKDYPHNLKLVYKSGKPYYYKSLSDLIVAQREIDLIKWLNKNNLAPFIITSSKPGTWYEKKIAGKLLVEAKLTDAVILHLATTLNRLHNLILPSNLRSILGSNSKYHPRNILKKLLSPIKSNTASINDLAETLRLIKVVEPQLKVMNYTKSLIHGDLSPRNIVINSDNDISLIDWSDARFDLASLDVCQLFYLNNFSQRQRKIFWQGYNRPIWMTEDLIKLHLRYLQIYDQVVDQLNRS